MSLHCQLSLSGCVGHMSAHRTFAFFRHTCATRLVLEAYTVLFDTGAEVLVLISSLVLQRVEVFVVAKELLIVKPWRLS